MGRKTCLGGTGDDAWEFARGIALTLDYSLHDAGVVRAQVDEAVGDTGVRDGLEEGRRRRIHGGQVVLGGGPGMFLLFRDTITRMCS